MATKILVGLVVALLGTGLGVYVAFRDTGGPAAAQPSKGVSASEGGCCSHGPACGDEVPAASCCPEGACQPDALAACAGGATFAVGGLKSKPVALNANVQ